VSWEDDIVLQILEQLGREATLWVLTLSEGRSVGTGRAGHYKEFTGGIKSFAKEHGIDPPEDDKIREGFRRLERVEFPDTEGRRDSVIEGDKPDYVKLTDHGITLVKLVSNRENLRKSVKENIGIEVDEESDGWWPRDYHPDNVTIQMEAISERPDDAPEEYEIEVEAQFICTRCKETVEHSYSFVEPTEAWSERVQTHCEECGMGWEHQAGNPYDNPDSVNREH